jgi:hypothetical protein
VPSDPRRKLTATGERHRQESATTDADQDKQSTELRSKSGIAEQNQTAKTAETRMDIGSPTRARTWDLRINSPPVSYDLIFNQALATHAKFQEQLRAA